MLLLFMSPILVIGMIILSVMTILFIISPVKKEKKLVPVQQFYVGEILYKVGLIYQKLCYSIKSLNFNEIENYCTSQFYSSIINKIYNNIKLPMTISYVKLISESNNIIETEIISFTSQGEYLKNTVKVIHKDNILLISEVR
jgi:hypothetical protein